ncbi:hypothetical protein BOTNAR_0019g00200 [Botryotinia narcissicola]|uniref:Uncharacterized protein n=1 Tax=Botryotinia narcissicola TaxID=278944 RepID=A0A4Z1J5H5_9HELO|nr:hypothetical protein BOTNAR_0019g00200 [Botryotinia narcissicola]
MTSSLTPTYKYYFKTQDKHASASTHNTSDLQADHDLWYKIRVLHDLHNIANNHVAQVRTQNTTDELYICGPYFMLEEASRIKGTIVSLPVLTEVPEFEELEFEGDLKYHVSPDTPVSEDETPKEMTVETVIKSCFQSFFEKRKASGDALPCGPHDMGPIDRAIFMFLNEELKDEKFLGRLRRAGLSEPRPNATGNVGNNKKKKNGRK